MRSLCPACCEPRLDRIFKVGKRLQRVHDEGAKVLWLKPDRKVELVVETAKGSLKRIVSGNEAEAQYLLQVGLRRIARDLRTRFSVS